jgi:hypothetical protein
MQQRAELKAAAVASIARAFLQVPQPDAPRSGHPDGVTVTVVVPRLLS